jgi:hypothetical protein
MLNIYYVYVYLREDGSPYYVGKGKDDRYKSYHQVNVPKDSSRIKIIKENLTEKEAFDLEVEMIFKYGRKDKGTGILRNLTDGGEGAAGAIRSEESKLKYSASKQGSKNPYYGKTGKDNPFHGKKHSTEQKEKWSEKRKGKMVGEKNPFYGKTHSEETKKIIATKSSIANSGENHPRYGKSCSVETKRKISETLKGKNKKHESKI